MTGPERHQAVARDGSVINGPAKHAALIDDMAQLRGASGPWWHVYGGIRTGGVWEGAVQVVFFGPSDLGPTDVRDTGEPVAAPVDGLPYLDSFDHEPTRDEREQLHAIASWPRVQFSEDQARAWLIDDPGPDNVGDTWAEVCGMWWCKNRNYVSHVEPGAELWDGMDPFCTEVDSFHDRAEAMVHHASRAGLFGGVKIQIWQTANDGDYADGALVQIDVPIDPAAAPLRLVTEWAAGGKGVGALPDPDVEGLECAVAVLASLARTAQAEIDRAARLLVSL